MNFKEIQELIKLIQKSNLTEFKVKNGEFELSLRTEKYQSGKTTQIVAPATQPILQASPAAVPVNTPSPAPAPSVDPDKGPAAAPAGEGSTGESSNYLAVRSPMVGTFYRSPAPDKGPYIKVGDVIEKGDVVCIVEAMKLFNEIESEHSGRVVKVMVEDAQPVEYDQVLFLLDPKG
ncbi:MAG: acetyl-CoA carboxylase biotin carboxyl carrier protein [Lewinellaceae bacterium]|nr:acetyl-CoA carboxylase biotin carboxyl carrier protein [Lewinellaceae bacterium]